MDLGGEARPVYISTVWTGSCWTDGGGEPVPACWVLSLTPCTEYPSAFGAIRNNIPEALHGIWTPQTSLLQLTALSVTDPRYSCSYAAVLHSEDDGSYTLRGQFQRENIHGRFILRSEGEDPNVHISGLWIGQAAPDVSLEAFAIPTNPIRWTIAILGDGAVFGAGYFDDSGDIAGRPLLFYALHGARTGDEVQIIKQYELAAACGVIPYKGRISRSATKEWQLDGEWRNEDAGSFGSFRCMTEGAANFLAHASCCDACQAVLRPPEMAYEDRESPQPWRCCAKCHNASKAAHRNLVQEPVLAAEAALGDHCAQIATSAFELFHLRPFIGYATAQKTFQWLTYGAIGAKARALAAGIQASGLGPGDRVALIGVLSPSYICAMLGTLLTGCLIVPLDPSLEPATMARCLKLANAKALFADLSLRTQADAAAKSSALNLSLSIALDARNDASPPAGCVTLDQFLSKQPTTLRSLPKRLPTDLVALLFTSGSTGEPKAALYSEGLTRPSAGTSNVLPLVKLDIQKFHPSFLLSLLSVMQVGGRRAIVDDLGRVLDVSREVRPTHISAPPAFWLFLQREYSAHLAQLTAAQKDTKSRAELEAEAAKFSRFSLGNRLVLAASGGALLSASALHFVRNTLKIPLSDLYGSRETGGIACNGVVYPGVEVRLLPLEASDTVTTLPAGPITRGEIAVHSNRLIQGYLADTQASSVAFVVIDDKRFYRTGDVGEFRGGKLAVLDRCGAMQKLMQSEWLAPSKVEAVLESCPWVSQALLVVPAPRTHLVAVVVPSMMALAELQKHAESEHAGVMLRQVQMWATHHRMRPHEIPKAVLLECAPWTVEAGLLTPTFKKRRTPLLAKYASACETLAGTLAAHPSLTSPSLSPFTVAFAALLARCGLPLGQVRADATLAEMGTDSLTCARIAALLFDVGIRGASSQTLHTYPLSHWDALYNAATCGGQVLPTAVVVEETVDWTSECSLPIALQRKCAAERQTGDIFVTGGTGFLGPFLLNAILGRTEGRNVHILVRAESDAKAVSRCKESLVTAGLWNQVQTHWDRVVVLQGDLASPHFGLSDSTWERLCASVADVFHSGARVDVTLPYTALRNTNVRGTLTAIDLALAAGARMHYISSASALPSSNPTEDWHVLCTDLAAKSGYGATKAVSEMLLYEASKQYGLSVCNIRYSAISGDERTHSWNPHDFSFLLLSAAAAVGALPTPARTLLHWVPVAWAAQATVLLALSDTTKNKCFHLIGEGPTLDECAAAMRTAGLQLRVCTQAEWSASALLASLPAQHQSLPLLTEMRGLDFASRNAHSIPTAATKAALLKLGLPWFTISPQLLASCAQRVGPK